MRRQKTDNFDKPYTKTDIKELRRLFKELEKAGESKSVQEYTKKVLAQLKS